MLQEPEQSLANTAEFGDLVDGELDRSLDAPVGIYLQPVAYLDEADWRRDDEFAPPRFLVARRDADRPHSALAGPKGPTNANRRRLRSW